MRTVYHEKTGKRLFVDPRQLNDVLNCGYTTTPPAKATVTAVEQQSSPTATNKSKQTRQPSKAPVAKK